MNQTPAVVGKGSYGCVYRPSLKCNNGVANHQDKISKLMLSKYAIAEMKEYDAISKIDTKNEYYLGKPILCRPDKSEENNIKKCMLSSASITADNSSLLIMPDGGMSISDYAKRLRQNKNPTQNDIAEFDTFLLKMHNALKIVKLMIENDLMHHDMKPQNMVYNNETESVNLIDFGLAIKKSDIVHRSKTNMNREISHWSYPPESKFINKDSFNNISSKPEYKKREYVATLIYSMNNGLNSEFASAFRIFFSIIGFHNKTDMDAHMQQYCDFLLNMGDYDNFLEKYVNTFDLYGLGITFITICNNCKKYMDKDNIDKLKEFSLRLIHPNMNLRYTVDSAIAEYETVVLKKILDARDLEFVNHELKPKPKNVIDLPSVHPDLFLTPKDISRMEIQPNLVGRCEPGKEISPVSGRCVKVCAHGQVRKANGRCGKDNGKVAQQKASLLARKCGPGKEISLNTGRCIKVCGPGTIRNTTGRCVKYKNAKNKTLKSQTQINNSTKRCAPGKEVNVTTGRCVKICGLGKTRNANGRCVKNN